MLSIQHNVTTFQIIKYKTNIFQKVNSACYEKELDFLLKGKGIQNSMWQMISVKTSDNCQILLMILKLVAI